MYLPPVLKKAYQSNLYFLAFFHSRIMQSANFSGSFAPLTSLPLSKKVTRTPTSTGGVKCVGKYDNIGRSGRFITHPKKSFFLKKSHIFEQKMCSRRVNIRSIRKPQQPQVRISIPYKPIKSDFQFRDIKFLAYFLHTV